MLRRLLRRTRRALLAFVASPPLVGILYVLLLASLAGSSTGGVDADVGDERKASAMETFITRRFPAELDRMKVGIVATAVALGILIGLVAELLLRLRHPRARLARRSPSGAFVTSVFLVGVLHAFLVAWAMADAPQLYAARWYAQGGGARTAQVLVTDSLGPRGVIALAFVFVLIYVRPKRVTVLFLRAAAVVRRPFRGHAVGVAVVLLLGALAHATPPPIAVAHAGPPRGEKDKGRLNVLVLAADSLRSDRLDPRIAPNLSRLADRGTRFDRAYVSLPRTFPSWVTILTGRHAHHHGIRSMFPTWEERARDFDALPGRLRAAGYETAVVSDYAGDIFSRIDLGFGRVDTPSFDFRQVIRQKVLERETPLLPILHSHTGRRMFPVMREIAAAADPDLLADDVEVTLRRVKDGPFFVTVFFSTAHFPYAAPAPYYAKYTDPRYRGRFKYHKPLGLGRASEAPPDAEDVAQIQALYDGAVAGIDDAVGRLLKLLQRLGVAERTLIVVTADHGETLFDHDHGQGHGDHLFGDEGTHVPLVLYDPRSDVAGRREGRVVRDVDLAPTIYELAGVAPPADLDGRSLAPAMRGEPLDARPAFAETELWFTEEIPALPPELRMPYPGVMGLTELDAHHNNEVVLRKEMQAPTLLARHRMVRDERFKLLYIPTRAGVRYMLFDTDGDPAETRDVAASFPNDVARLKAELWSWMLKDPQMDQRDGYLVPRGPK